MYSELDITDLEEGSKTPEKINQTKGSQSSKKLIPDTLSVSSQGEVVRSVCEISEYKSVKNSRQSSPSQCQAVELGLKNDQASSSDLKMQIESCQQNLKIMMDLEVTSEV